MESTIGTNSLLPKLGDWTADNGNQYNQYTPRSSDFMPAHFHAFARVSGNSTWNNVVLNSQAVIDTLQSNHSPVTGLLPDFIVNCNNTSNCQPAQPNFLEGSNDGHYYYNAGRSPWRIGLDALLNDNAQSKSQVLKMVNWLAASTNQNVNNIKAGYTLSGSPIGNYTTSFFIAPFGVAAMLDSSKQNFLNAIYTSIYNNHENYYEDSVNLLSLLAITGNYWNPDEIITPPALCNDGIDNDGDGLTDYPADTGCTSADDNDETDLVNNQDLVIQLNTTANWEEGYCSNVNVSNPNSIAIDWDIDFTIEGIIYNSWSAFIEQSDQQVSAQGVSWNNVVPANGSIDFGFCAEFETPQELSIEINNTADWGAGYCSNVTVNNPTSSAIDWDVNFTVEGDIYTSWSADVQQNGQEVTAQGVSWNNLVPSNSSVNFGFCARR